jgi:hypothetical protein
MDRQAAWIVEYEMRAGRALSPNLCGPVDRTADQPTTARSRAGTCRIDQLSGSIGAIRDSVNGVINDLGNIIRRPQQHREDRRPPGAAASGSTHRCAPAATTASPTVEW